MPASTMPMAQGIDEEAGGFACASSESVSLPAPQQLPGPAGPSPDGVLRQPLIPHADDGSGYVAMPHSVPMAGRTSPGAYAPGPFAVYAPPQQPMMPFEPSEPPNELSRRSFVIVALLSCTFGFLGGRLADLDWFGSSPTTGVAAGGGNVTVPGAELMSAVTKFDFLTQEMDSVGCPAGVMLPGIRRTPLNTIIQLCLLLWSFVGVALGADVFMMSIEFITSAERIVKTPVDGGVRSFSVLMWNPTVANLTLMALGSSAPEILLSIIEVMSNKFYAGELGPSTIVGSAAFNLMVISAVCVVCIPEGESRRIKELPVFYITASFSIFAYLWIIVILVMISPNIVEVWEGIATFMFFLVLVLLAYLADVKEGPFAQPKPAGEGSKIVAINREGKAITADDASRAYKMVKDGAVDPDSHADAMRELLSGPKSKAAHKLDAKKPGIPAFDKGPVKFSSVVANADQTSKAGKSMTTISLESDRLFVPPADKFVEMLVLRTGKLDVAATVNWHAVTAVGEEPFKEGQMAFEKFQERRFVRLQRAELPPDAENVSVVLVATSPNSQLGQISRCDADMKGGSLKRGPGQLSFEYDTVAVRESSKKVSIVVERRGGNSNEVTVDFNTVDGTASAGSDYIAVKTTLTFASGEMRKEVVVSIEDDGKYERDEFFLVELYNPAGGATLAGAADDADQKAVCEVTIISDEEERGIVDNLLAVLNFDSDHARLGGSDWCEQIAEAVAFPEEGNCLLNLFLYILTLPFKIVFALPPPPHVFGGWACFCTSLALIGVLTAFIGDFANHVGCGFGISSSTTAITLVALGTSLPDTFASMSAAKSEPYADASIGNVTGSNSVNVFLGLGLPWMIAAIYWANAGTELEAAWRSRYASEPWYDPSLAVGFAVPAGKLGVSVAIFTVTAFLTLGTLMLRRAREGHELGGVNAAKYVTGGFFVLLWLAYIVLSIALG